MARELASAYEKAELAANGVWGRLFVSVGLSFSLVWNAVGASSSYYFVDMSKVGLFYVLVIVVAGIFYALYGKTVEFLRYLAR